MPLPQEQANPFTMVYDKLWDMVNANPALCEWLKPGNQINFADRTGAKTDKTVADTPELVLLSDNTFTNIHNTSHTTAVTKGYTWVLLTADFDLNRIFNQVSWELFRSMVDWDLHLCTLQWKTMTDSFVKEFRLLNSSEGISQSDMIKGLEGWGCEWPMEVDMHFPTSLLRI